MGSEMCIRDSSENSSDNPLELLVEIVGANDWPHERTGLNELAVEINGRWCNYRLFFLWQEEMGRFTFRAFLKPE